MVEWDPPVVTIEVVCGKGTYLRSLANDLGESLGCGGTLTSLLRTKVGPFRIEDAIKIGDLEESFRKSYWRRYAFPLDQGLLNWNVMIVGDERAKQVCCGSPLNVAVPHSSTTPYGDHCRVYDLDGYLLGVLRFDPKENVWKARKVIG